MIKIKLNEGTNVRWLKNNLRKFVTVGNNDDYFQFVFVDESDKGLYLKHFKEILKDNQVNLKRDITNFDTLSVLNVAKILMNWNLIDLDIDPKEKEKIFDFENGYRILRFFKILKNDEVRKKRILNPLRELKLKEQ